MKLTAKTEYEIDAVIELMNAAKEHPHFAAAALFQAARRLANAQESCVDSLLVRRFLEDFDDTADAQGDSRINSKS